MSLFDLKYSTQPVRDSLL